EAQHEGEGEGGARPGPRRAARFVHALEVPLALADHFRLIFRLILTMFSHAVNQTTAGTLGTSRFWYTGGPWGRRPDFSRREPMQQLALPVRHEWLARERSYGKIAIEPFEPGLALTVGNAYRRVLLSSIPGAAPTWVKIEGVLHEFSHMQGVTEDTLDIIMNLRKLVFALHVNRPKLLRLKAQGPCTVTARDFEPDAYVEILTPDVVLATVDKDGAIEMEVCVERGRGYQGAEKREPEALPINAMLIDSDFVPVKRANFQVETLDSSAGGQERLVLELWTDGSVLPEAAVGEASRILEDQFELMTNFMEAPPPETEHPETGEEPLARM